MLRWARERRLTVVGPRLLSMSINRREHTMKARIITLFFTVMALAAALAPIAEAGRIGAVEVSSGRRREGGRRRPPSLLPGPVSRRTTSDPEPATLLEGERDRLVERHRATEFPRPFEGLVAEGEAHASDRLVVRGELEWMVGLAADLPAQRVARPPQPRRRLGLVLAARTPSRRARASRGGRPRSGCSRRARSRRQASTGHARGRLAPRRSAPGRRASPPGPRTSSSSRKIACDSSRYVSARVPTLRGDERCTPGCRGRSQAPVAVPDAARARTHSSHRRAARSRSPRWAAMSARKPIASAAPSSSPLSRSSWQRLRRSRCRPIEVALLHLDEGQTAERSRPRPASTPDGLQRRLEPASPLAQVAAAHPEARKGAGESQRARRVAALEQVRED